MLTKTEKHFPDDLPVLTSLRFFAALFTALFHMHFFYGKSFFPFVDNIMSKGDLAVDFFFILSGFILTHCYLSHILEGHFTYKNFIIRRLARIYPVHLFTFGGAVLMLWIASARSIPLMADAFFISYFFHHLLLIHAWGLDSRLSYNQVSWSISAEFFAYLLFPFFLRTALSMKPLEGLMIALTGCVILSFISLPFFGVELTEMSTWGFLRIIPTFFLGVCLYLFAKKYEFRYASDRVMAATAALIIISFALLARDWLILPLLCFMIYVGAEQTRQGISGFLSKPWAVYLGRISYSFYMVQYCVWFILMNILLRDYSSTWLDIRIIWIVSLGLVILAASATYHFIEQPAHAWINSKFAKKRTQT